MSGAESASLMVQGTASHAGKSLITAGLIRLFSRRKLRVAPFKPQNMSNNAAVCPSGGEIGRAQALQAAAAGIEPRTDFNPILLKPEGDGRVQVVLFGRPVGSMTPSDYFEWARAEGLPSALEAFRRLKAGFDLVVAEGAGSPAEINLPGEIANMGFAREADLPVILVGDIDRGGVFASLHGTVDLLEPSDRSLLGGIVINKFRGDPSILEKGLEMIEELTGLPVLGVVPFIEGLSLPEEDSLGIGSHHRPGASLVIDVIRLPRISNFTDFDPLLIEDIDLAFVTSPPRVMPDLIIIPGTKDPTGDLLFMEETGLSDWVKRAAGSGVAVLGICGGFQVLGQGITTGKDSTRGLGLLPVTTRMEEEKETRLVSGSSVAGNEPFTGYEIHHGVTTLIEGAEVGPIFRILHEDGSIREEGIELGNIMGTYCHGIFEKDHFRRGFLDRLRRALGRPRPTEPVAEYSIGAGLDLLADTIGSSLDMTAMEKIAGLSP